jgi:hypothetical protein
MKWKLLVLLFLFTGSISAQDLSVGGFVSASRGTVEYLRVKPVIRPGIGLSFNYYLKKFVFNTGLSLKSVGGSEEVTVTTMNQPDGIDKRKILYSLQIINLPLGVNYTIVRNSKLAVLGGIQFECGLIANARYRIEDEEWRRSTDVNRFYKGIAPRISLEHHISDQKFFFLNIGYSYQFGEWQSTPNRIWNIQNYFAEFGFACRLMK